MYSQMDHAPAGFFSLTDSGILLDVNDTFSKMLEYDKEELINMHIETFMSVPNKFFFHTYFYPYIRLYGVVEEMYLLLKTSSGKKVPILLFGRKFKDNIDDKIICVCVHIPKRVEYEKEIRSISTKVEEAYREKDIVVEKLNILITENEKKNKELTELNKKLETLATTDLLTGLYNRQFFIVALANMIHSFEQDDIPFSLAILDIDFFKTVNDTWGHLEGDQVLIQFATIMKATFGKDATLVRYGGEEFIALLPNLTQEAAVNITNQFRIAIENANWGKATITVSAGIATYTKTETDQSLLTIADRALYASKENGRNRVIHSVELMDL